MSHHEGIKRTSSTVHAAGPAPAPTTATVPARNSGRAAVVFRPAERLHVGSALLLTAPLARLDAARFPRTVLLLDYGHGGSRPGVSGLTDASLDRLACLASDPGLRIAVASAVPSIARLAAVVASQVEPRDRVAATDARSWFAEILLAAGMIATRATHAVVEAGVPDDFALTRRLVGCLDKVMPGACPRPLPALSGMSPFRGLDGSAAMGASTRGTIYVTDSPDEVARKVRSARTDTRPALDPEAAMSEEVRNLILLLHALSGEPVGSILTRFAGHGYAPLKEALAEAANSWLAPIRARRAALLHDEPALTARLASDSAALDRSAAELADTFMREPELLVA